MKTGWALLLAACLAVRAEGKPVAERVTLAKSVVVKLGKRAVGVGPFLDGDYTDKDGHAHKGPNVTLTPIPEDGEERVWFAVGPGQTFKIDGIAWRVESIEGEHGAVVRVE